MGWMNDSGIKDAWYAGGDRHDPSHVVARSQAAESWRMVAAGMSYLLAF